MRSGLHRVCKWKINRGYPVIAEVMLGFRDRISQVSNGILVKNSNKTLPDAVSRRRTRCLSALIGGTSHFDDEWMMYANYAPIYWENGVRVHVPNGFYSSEFYTSKLIEYLDERPADHPFFGYLAFTAPHAPLHAPDDWIEKYKGKYDAGYDALR